MIWASYDSRGEAVGRNHHRSILGSGPASGATHGPRASTVDRYRRGLGQQAVSLGRRSGSTRPATCGFRSPDRTGAAVASPAFSATTIARSCAAPCRPARLWLSVVMVSRTLVSRPKCAARPTGGSCDDRGRSGAVSSRAPSTRTGRCSTQPVARCAPDGSYKNSARKSPATRRRSVPQLGRRRQNSQFSPRVIDSRRDRRVGSPHDARCPHRLVGSSGATGDREESAPFRRSGRIRQRPRLGGLLNYDEHAA